MEISDMIRNVKTILASGLTALLIAGTAVSESTPPPALATEQADDSAITAKVKEAITADTALVRAEINIETVQGEVRLSGFVGDPDHIPRVTALAFGVEGVKAVRNDLKAK